jgi:hypothetical protein
MKKGKKTNWLVIVGIIVALAIILTVFNNPSPKPQESYAVTPRVEPSLACNLGGRTCTQENGHPGLCDSVTSNCVALPDWELYKIQTTSPPVGEFSWDCQRTNKVTCARSDMTMGVCMSGWCYPNSSDVR